MTRRFESLIAASDPLLDELALVIAAHARPGIDVHAELERLDTLAAQVAQPTLDGVRHLLFRDMGFAGNRGDYYDPANSLLPEVLDRRVGNPIMLSILLIAVGRRVGVELEPVGMPGHFLVRDHAHPDTFVDPFHQGAMLDVSQCADLFARLAGPAASFDLAYLTPTKPHHVIARVLNNLVAIYQRSGRVDDLGWAATLRSMVAPSEGAGLDKIAAALGSAGRYQPAARIYDSLALAAADPEESERLTASATTYWARLN